MNAHLTFLLLICIPGSLLAETSTELVQRLVADAWAPRTVRVEWKFSGKAPADLEQFSDWKLVEPRSTHLAGNVILAFERKDTLSGTTKKVIITGTARVFGPSFTVKQVVPAGQSVNISNLDSLEAEWTYLSGDAAALSDFSPTKIAARGLTPGRVIITRDIKGTKLIHRGQTVDVKYADGSVRIRIAGRALADGAIGDVVPVSTDLVAARRLSGTVRNDGSIQLVR